MTNKETKPDSKALDKNPFHTLTEHFDATIAFAYDVSKQEYIARIAGKEGRGANMEASVRALAAHFR